MSEKEIPQAARMDTTATVITKGTQMRNLIRSITAKALVPVMKLTGFRFSKDYRWGTTAKHRFIYRWVDTVGANLDAGIVVGI